MQGTTHSVKLNHFSSAFVNETPSNVSKKIVKKKSFAPKAEARMSESAYNDADETLDHPPQRAEPVESPKNCRSSRYTLWKTRRVLFQENWMIKTCTGYQEVQQLWQTEAIFQHKKTIVRIYFFNNPIIVSSSLIFFSNKSACDFRPSGELRMISSSFFGVLIPAQSFRKDAEIVDRRFSVMSPRKTILIS